MEARAKDQPEGNSPETRDVKKVRKGRAIMYRREQGSVDASLVFRLDFALDVEVGLEVVVLQSSFGCGCETASVELGRERGSRHSPDIRCEGS